MASYAEIENVHIKFKLEQHHRGCMTVIASISNQIKLYFPTYINTNMLYMMKYTYWKKGWKRS